MNIIGVEAFLSMGLPIIDVRAPIEFVKGHIPGAHNLPIFEDEERAILGTLYKESDREKAIQKGLQFVGPKLHVLAQRGKEYAQAGALCIHCFRGGLRSQSIAWLFSLMGIKVYLLDGGYKAFRNWALNIFARKRSFFVLGGLTGVAKTEILHALRGRHAAVIDLEGLAQHKGSAFGGLIGEKQPSQVNFENALALSLWGQQASQEIWIEDESRSIGKRVIPHDLWIQMRASPVIFLERSLEERVAHLQKGYGKFSSQELEACIVRIRKRFGPNRSKEVLQMIQEGRYEEAIPVILEYYDKGYRHGLSKRKKSSITHLDIQGVDYLATADMLLNHVHTSR